MKLRDQILSCTDIQEETVTIPEWGGAVLLVRGLTAGERGAIYSAVDIASGKADIARMQCLMVIACACDPETKERVFVDTDLDPLKGKSGKAIERISEVAMRLSGMSADAKAALEKNSEAASGTPTSVSLVN